MKNVLAILGVITAVSLVGLLAVGLSRIGNDADEQPDATVSTIGPNAYEDLFSDDHVSDELHTEAHEEEPQQPQTQTYPEVELPDWNLSIAGADIKSVQPTTQSTESDINPISELSGLQPTLRQTSIASQDIITDRQQRIREIVRLSDEQYDQCYGTLSRLMRIDASDVVDDPNHLPLWHNQSELNAHGIKVGDNYYVFAYHFFSSDASQCDQLDNDASRLSLENTLADSDRIMTWMRQQAVVSDE